MQQDVDNLDAYDPDEASQDQTLKQMKDHIGGLDRQAKGLASTTQARYKREQHSVPAEVGQQLVSLELLADTVMTAMADKERDCKRARTQRYDFTGDVADAEAWLQQSEAKLLDKSLQPANLKEQIQVIQGGLGAVEEKVAKVESNGHLLCERTQNTAEQELIRSTVTALADQLLQLKKLLDERNEQVLSALDAWQRFLQSHSALKTWIMKTQTFLSEKLHYVSLSYTKQKLTEYQSVQKECTQMQKHITDMTRELERIVKVGNAGDLPDMKAELEQEKIEVEKQLHRKTLLLMEMTEEWEQCERKVKEVTTWLEKHRQSIESSQGKKRPLRDQLAMREKLAAEISTQKTKMMMSIEKLAVHFKDANMEETQIITRGRHLQSELDALYVVVAEQHKTLDVAVAQLDKYQHEVQELKRQVTNAEQHLRVVSSPMFSPRDRKKQQEEQDQEFKEQVEEYASAFEAVELEVISVATLQDLHMQQIKIQHLETELSALESWAVTLERTGLSLEKHAEVIPVIQELSTLSAKLKLLKVQLDKRQKDLVKMFTERERHREQADKYLVLLKELENWVSEMFTSLNSQLKFTTVDDIKELIRKHEEIEIAFATKEEELEELMKKCEELKTFEDIARLVIQILDQLLYLRKAIIDAKSVIGQRLKSLQSSLKTREMILDQARFKEEQFHERSVSRSSEGSHIEESITPGTVTHISPVFTEENAAISGQAYSTVEGSEQGLITTDVKQVVVQKSTHRMQMLKKVITRRVDSEGNIIESGEEEAPSDADFVYPEGGSFVTSEEQVMQIPDRGFQEEFTESFVSEEDGVQRIKRVTRMTQSVVRKKVVRVQNVIVDGKIVSTTSTEVISPDEPESVVITDVTEERLSRPSSSSGSHTQSEHYDKTDQQSEVAEEFRFHDDEQMADASESEIQNEQHAKEVKEHAVVFEQHLGVLDERKIDDRHRDTVKEQQTEIQTEDADKHMVLYEQQSEIHVQGSQVAEDANEFERQSKVFDVRHIQYSEQSEHQADASQKFSIRYDQQTKISEEQEFHSEQQLKLDESEDFQHKEQPEKAEEKQVQFGRQSEIADNLDVEHEQQLQLQEQQKWHVQEEDSFLRNDELLEEQRVVQEHKEFQSVEGLHEQEINIDVQMTTVSTEQVVHDTLDRDRLETLEKQDQLVESNKPEAFHQFPQDNVDTVNDQNVLQQERQQFYLHRTASVSEQQVHVTMEDNLLSGTTVQAVEVESISLHPQTRSDPEELYLRELQVKILPSSEQEHVAREDAASVSPTPWMSVVGINNEPVVFEAKMTLRVLESPTPDLTIQQDTGVVMKIDNVDGKHAVTEIPEPKDDIEFKPSVMDISEADDVGLELKQRRLKKPKKTRKGLKQDVQGVDAGEVVPQIDVGVEVSEEDAGSVPEQETAISFEDNDAQYPQKKKKVKKPKTIQTTESAVEVSAESLVSVSEIAEKVSEVVALVEVSPEQLASNEQEDVDEKYETANVIDEEISTPQPVIVEQKQLEVDSDLSTAVIDDDAIVADKETAELVLNENNTSVIESEILDKERVSAIQRIDTNSGAASVETGVDIDNKNSMKANENVSEQELEIESSHDDHKPDRKKPKAKKSKKKGAPDTQEDGSEHLTEVTLESESIELRQTAIATVDRDDVVEAQNEEVFSEIVTSQKIEQNIVVDFEGKNDFQKTDIVFDEEGMSKSIDDEDANFNQKKKKTRKHPKKKKSPEAAQDGSETFATDISDQNVIDEPGGVVDVLKSVPETDLPEKPETIEELESKVKIETVEDLTKVLQMEISRTQIPGDDTLEDFSQQYEIIAEDTERAQEVKPVEDENVLSDNRKSNKSKRKKPKPETKESISDQLTENLTELECFEPRETDESDIQQVSESCDSVLQVTREEYIIEEEINADSLKLYEDTVASESDLYKNLTISGGFLHEIPSEFLSGELELAVGTTELPDEESEEKHENELPEKASEQEIALKSSDDEEPTTDQITSEKKRKKRKPKKKKASEMNDSVPKQLIDETFQPEIPDQKRDEVVTEEHVSVLSDSATSGDDIVVLEEVKVEGATFQEGVIDETEFFEKTAVDIRSCHEDQNEKHIAELGTVISLPLPAGIIAPESLELIKVDEPALEVSVAEGSHDYAMSDEDIVVVGEIGEEAIQSDSEEQTSKKKKSKKRAKKKHVKDADYDACLDGPVEHPESYQSAENNTAAVDVDDLDETLQDISSLSTSDGTLIEDLQTDSHFQPDVVLQDDICPPPDDATIHDIEQLTNFDENKLDSVCIAAEEITEQGADTEIDTVELSVEKIEEKRIQFEEEYSSSQGIAVEEVGFPVQELEGNESESKDEYKIKTAQKKVIADGAGDGGAETEISDSVSVNDGQAHISVLHSSELDDKFENSQKNTDLQIPGVEMAKTIAWKAELLSDEVDPIISYQKLEFSVAPEQEEQRVSKEVAVSKIEEQELDRKFEVLKEDISFQAKETSDNGVEVEGELEDENHIDKGLEISMQEHGEIVDGSPRTAQDFETPEQRIEFFKQGFEMPIEDIDACAHESEILISGPESTIQEAEIFNEDFHEYELSLKETVLPIPESHLIAKESDISGHNIESFVSEDEFLTQKTDLILEESEQSVEIGLATTAKGEISVHGTEFSVEEAELPILDDEIAVPAVKSISNEDLTAPDVEFSVQETMFVNTGELAFEEHQDTIKQPELLVLEPNLDNVHYDDTQFTSVGSIMSFAETEMTSLGSIVSLAETELTSIGSVYSVAETELTSMGSELSVEDHEVASQEVLQVDDTESTAQGIGLPIEVSQLLLDNTQISVENVPTIELGTVQSNLAEVESEISVQEIDTSSEPSSKSTEVHVEETNIAVDISAIAAEDTQLTDELLKQEAPIPGYEFEITKDFEQPVQDVTLVIDVEAIEPPDENNFITKDIEFPAQDYPLTATDTEVPLQVQTNSAKDEQAPAEEITMFVEEATVIGEETDLLVSETQIPSKETELDILDVQSATTEVQLPIKEADSLAQHSIVSVDNKFDVKDTDQKESKKKRSKKKKLPSEKLVENVIPVHLQEESSLEFSKSSTEESISETIQAVSQLKSLTVNEDSIGEQSDSIVQHESPVKMPRQRKSKSKSPEPKDIAVEQDESTVQREAPVKKPRQNKSKSKSPEPASSVSEQMGDEDQMFLHDVAELEPDVDAVVEVPMAPERSKKKKSRKPKKIVSDNTVPEDESEREPTPASDASTDVPVVKRRKPKKTKQGVESSDSIVTNIESVELVQEIEVSDYTTDNVASSVTNVLEASEVADEISTKLCQIEASEVVDEASTILDTPKLAEVIAETITSEHDVGLFENILEPPILEADDDSVSKVIIETVEDKRVIEITERKDLETFETSESNLEYSNEAPGRILAKQNIVDESLGDPELYSPEYESSKSHYEKPELSAFEDQTNVIDSFDRDNVHDFKVLSIDAIKNRSDTETSSAIQINIELGQSILPQQTENAEDTVEESNAEFSFDSGLAQTPDEFPNILSNSEQFEDFQEIGVTVTPTDEPLPVNVIAMEQTEESASITESSEETTVVETEQLESEGDRKSLQSTDQSSSDDTSNAVLVMEFISPETIVEGQLRQVDEGEDKNEETVVITDVTAELVDEGKSADSSAESDEGKSSFSPLGTWDRVRGKVLSMVRRRSTTTNSSPVSRTSPLKAGIRDDYSLEERLRILQLSADAIHAAGESGNEQMITREVITIFETITQWIETIEYRRVTIERIEDTRCRLEAYKLLEEEMQRLQSFLNDLRETSASSLQLCQHEFIVSFTETITTVMTKVVTIQKIVEESYSSVEKLEEILLDHKEKVNYLQDKLCLVQERITTELLTLNSVNEQLSIIQLIEEEYEELQLLIVNLISSAEYLSSHNVSLNLTRSALLGSLKQQLGDIKQQLSWRKEALNRARNLQEQYEKLLYEFDNLLGIAELKLQYGIIVKDVHNLKIESDRHKKFFSRLHQCHASLDALALATDETTRNRRAEWHHQLKTRSGVLVDKATQEGYLLDQLTVDWENIAEFTSSIHQSLCEAVAKSEQLSRISPGNLKQHLQAYENIQTSIVPLKPHIEKCLVDCRRILKSVKCSSLSEQVKEIDELWKIVSVGVLPLFEQLQSLSVDWEDFEILYRELETWIDSQRLSFGTTDVEDIMEGNSPEGEDGELKLLQRIWDVQAVMSNKDSEKTEIVNRAGKVIRTQLLQQDTIENYVVELETKWTELQTLLSTLERQLVERRKIVSTITRTTTEIEEFVVTSAQFFQAINITEVVDIRQFKEQLASCQGILNRIENRQKELLLLTESANIEDEAVTDTERIAELNQQLGTLTMEAKNQLAFWNSLSFEEKLFEALVLKLLTSVSKTSNEINNLGIQLKNDRELCQEAVQKIEDLRHHANTTILSQLREVQEFESKLSRELRHPVLVKHLQDNVANATSSFENLLSELDTVFAMARKQQDKWISYGLCEQRVKNCLIEMNFALDQFGIPATEVAALDAQLQKLKELLEMIQTNSQLLANLNSEGDSLEEDYAVDVLNSGVVRERSLNKQWESCKQRLEETVSLMEESLLLWRTFVIEYEQIRGWIELCDEQFQTDLLGQSTSERPIEELIECSQMKLEETNEVEKKITVMRTSAECLEKLTTISECARSHIPGQVDFLQQKLVSLQENHRHNCTLLEKQLKERRQCEKQIRDLKAVMDRADQAVILPIEELDVEALATASLTLLNVVDDMNNRETSITKLNEVQGRLGAFTLPETVITEVSEVLSRWKQVYENVVISYRDINMEHFKRLQFSGKVEHVQRVTSTTAQQFAVEPSPDFDTLVHQHRSVEMQELVLSCQESVIHNSEEVLAGVPADKMQEALLQLKNLEDILNASLEQTSERKEELMRRIELWQRYHTLYRTLYNWLLYTEKDKLKLQVRNAPIKMIEDVLKTVKVVIDNIKAKEALLAEVKSAKLSLMNAHDEEHANVMIHEVAVLQNRMDTIVATLSTWGQFLQREFQMWNDCEQVVSHLQKRMLAIKESILDKQPNSFDEIVNTLKICQDGLAQLLDFASKLEEVTEKEKKLREGVSPEDVRILHERVLLVREMWIEMRHEMEIFITSLNERLAKWTEFDEQCENFHSWAIAMQAKLDDKTGEMFYEDVVNKLENVYKIEIREKSMEKDSIVNLGRQLMSVSSDAQAEEISRQIEKIGEEWQKLDDSCTRKLCQSQESLDDCAKLEKKMKVLCDWLHKMERILSAPIVYQECTRSEIDRHLALNQDLKQEVDDHQVAITSVQSLCSALLENLASKGVHGEANSLQPASDNLDKRWKSICSALNSRNETILSTWQLWQNLLQALGEFNKYLLSKETVIQNMVSAKTDVLSVSLPDRIKDCEAHLSDMDRKISNLGVSVLYRQCVRQNRTDVAHTFKSWVNEANFKFDSLRKEVYNLMQFLKSCNDKWEEFRSMKTDLLLYLTSTDHQLTEIEHLSELDVQSKLEKLQEMEIYMLSRKVQLDALREFGSSLIEFSHMSDIKVVERELEELGGFYDDIFSRIQKCKSQLQAIFDDDHFPVQDEQVDISVQVDTLNLNGSIQEKHVQMESSQSAEAPIVEVPVEESVSVESSSIQRCMRDLEKAVLESHANLNSMEKLLAKPTPLGPESEKSPNQYTKLVAKCWQSVDLVKHYGDILNEELRQTSTGSDLEISGKIDVIQKWERLEVEASKRDRQLKEAMKSWQQFKSDLASVEAWLTEADSYKQSNQSIPKELQNLVSAIETHSKQFLPQLDSKKAIVMSINIHGEEILKQTVKNKSDINKLRERLKKMNHRWDLICKYSLERQQKLQDALAKCKQIHEAMNDLSSWLEMMESRVRSEEPVDIEADLIVIRAKVATFKEIKTTLEECRSKIDALKNVCNQVVQHSSSHEGVTLNKKVKSLSKRLKALLRVCSLYIQQLEKFLDNDGTDMTDRAQCVSSEYELDGRSLNLSKQFLDSDIPQDSDLEAAPLQNDDATEESDTPTSRIGNCVHFCGRVMRAALPIQALMLLLLGIASLVPIYEEDYSCALSNNFARSLDPMLHYTNGPPPV